MEFVLSRKIKLQSYLCYTQVVFANFEHFSRTNFSTPSFEYYLCLLNELIFSNICFLIWKKKAGEKSWYLGMLC